MQSAHTGSSQRDACMQRGLKRTYSTVKRMRMKRKLLFFPTVMVIMSALAVDSSSATTTAWTTRGPGLNLSGKMFTLSTYRGGICFYSPYWSPPPFSTPYQSRFTTDSYSSTVNPPTSSIPPKTSTPTTHTSHRPWTTAPTTRGVSVCFRYITDYMQANIFTLSPSSSPLRLDTYMGTYTLTDNGYNSIQLKPSIRLWSDVGQSIWTSVCLTLDSVKGVAQMFSNSNMSVRKVLPYRYVWSGEPVIDFKGFDGQVTDVEVWDYPLSYKQVLYYMSRGRYGPYQGSMLTWSYISYSLSGNTLLEDSYEQQMNQLENREARRHRVKGEKMDRKFLNKRKRNEINEQRI